MDFPRAVWGLPVGKAMSFGWQGVLGAGLSCILTFYWEMHSKGQLPHMCTDSSMFNSPRPCLHDLIILPCSLPQWDSRALAVPWVIIVPSSDGLSWERNHCPHPTFVPYIWSSLSPQWAQVHSVGQPYFVPICPHSPQVAVSQGKIQIDPFCNTFRSLLYLDMLCQNWRKEMSSRICAPKPFLSL